MWRPRWATVWRATPVVDHRLHEGVRRDVADHRDRQRPTSDHMAHLAGVGVPTPPGPQVHDEDDVGAVRPPAARPLEHPHQCVGCVCVTRLGGASTSRLATDAVGLRVEPVHEREPDLRRQLGADVHHRIPVAPVAHGAGFVPEAVQLRGIRGGETCRAGLVLQRPQVV